MTRPTFTVEAKPVSPIVRGRRTSAAESRCTVVLRINGHRRRITPAEARQLGMELLRAAESGEVLEAATWSLS